MSITLNTYGLRSINAESFNTYGSNGYLPKSIRDITITLLKINNLVLNILGYIPGIAQISGCVRIGMGAATIVLTLALGNPNEERGLIVGRWYREALLTGIAQAARGALEAFVPLGRMINGSLDILGTYANLKTECSHMVYDPEGIYERKEDPPYRDPDYPLLFLPLYFA